MTDLLIIGGVALLLIIVPLIFVVLKAEPARGVIVKASSPEEAVAKSGLSLRELPPGSVIGAVPMGSDYWRVEFECSLPIDGKPTL